MLAPRWAKAAAVYFMIGTSFGYYMATAGDFRWPHLHSHLNLLGWASMGIIAALLHAFPVLERHKLASAQFWMYQVGTPLMMLGLFLITLDRLDLGIPLTIVGGTGVWLAVIVFGIMAFTTIRREQPSAVNSESKAG